MFVSDTLWQRAAAVMGNQNSNQQAYASLAVDEEAPAPTYGFHTRLRHSYVFCLCRLAVDREYRLSCGGHKRNCFLDWKQSVHDLCFLILPILESFSHSGESFHISLIISLQTQNSE